LRQIDRKVNEMTPVPGAFRDHKRLRESDGLAPVFRSYVRFHTRFIN